MQAEKASQSVKNYLTSLEMLSLQYCCCCCRNICVIFSLLSRSTLAEDNTKRKGSKRKQIWRVIAEQFEQIIMSTNRWWIAWCSTRDYYQYN